MPADPRDIPGVVFDNTPPAAKALVGVVFDNTAPAAQNLPTSNFDNPPWKVVPLVFEVLVASNSDPADTVPGQTVDDVIVQEGDRLLGFGSGDGTDKIYVVSFGGPSAAPEATYDELVKKPYVKVRQGTT